MKQYGLLFLCVFVFTYYIFTQEVRESDESSLLAIEQTLQYGIDQAVVQSIKSLAELDIDTYAEEVFQRMSETTNDDLLITGFQYFNAIKYKDTTKTIPFAVKIMKEYKQSSRRVEQYAMYYIKDNIDFLGDSISKEELLDLIIDIVDTDIPAIALPALEMLPVVYSKKSITQKDADNSSKLQTTTAAEQELSTATVKQYTTTKDESVQYFDALRHRYDITNVGVIRTAILTVLAQIQAYSQIDFILSIATDESTSKNIRGVAIKALALFENPDEAVKKSILDTYETLRSDTQPTIRSAVLTGIGSVSSTFFGNENIHYTWLRNSLRDSDYGVRIAGLQAILSRIEKNDPVIDDLGAIEFMIENDPEVSVKTKAIEVLASYSFNTKGREYIFDKVQHISYPNALDKKFIDAVLDDFMDDGGVDVLVDLVASISNPKSSVVEYIASVAKQYESKQLLPLAKLLIRSPDSSVRLNALSLIGRNKFIQYQQNVESLSKDRSTSNRIRIHAQQVLQVLSNNNSEEQGDKKNVDLDSRATDPTVQSSSQSQPSDLTKKQQKDQ